MRGNFRGSRSQSAQIDDPLHSGLFRRSRKVLRGAPVAILETRMPATHGVNQVVRHFDSLHGWKQAVGKQGIALDHGCTFHPMADARRLPHHARDIVSACQELREQLPTHIAGRACNQDFHDCPAFNRQMEKLSTLAKETHIA